MPINRWEHRLNLGDVFHNDDLTFEAKRDGIVRRIKAARFYRPDDDVWLERIVYDIEDSTDTDDFDSSWDEFYDWCDVNRVWVETIARP